MDLPKVKENPAAAEKNRIILLVLKKKAELVAEYKTLMKHTGDLISGSMVVAYDRAINDIVKLLTKENLNEELVQKEE